jgi:hypothetical protein
MESGFVRHFPRAHANRVRMYNATCPMARSHLFPQRDCLTLPYPPCKFYPFQFIIHIGRTGVRMARSHLFRQRDCLNNFINKNMSCRVKCASPAIQLRRVLSLAVSALRSESMHQ